MRLNGLNTIKRNGDVVRSPPVWATTTRAHRATSPDATVTLHRPLADGSPNGQNVVLATGVDFPSGAAITTYPP